MAPNPLPAGFYARDALDVAADLLGCEVAANGVRLRITEVEAYRFPGDTANHARMGRTPRNAPMWGPPGHAYVYLCYGLHRMLNLVTGPEGHAAAVLVRGAELISGEALWRARRPDGRCDGPGKVGAALGIGVADSGSPCFGGGPIVVSAGSPPALLLAGPRIGIDYAAESDRVAPWRLADGDSRQVGRRRGLR
ncbi:putative 3-methyladenine DNA glycosylase [Deltaproteobacteria bacterium]|nr:putative 3-methyladenine DNA glycosylase [Deltaproteobacteria bacterium]